jgi:hypothetical protein
MNRTLFESLFPTKEYCRHRNNRHQDFLMLPMIAIAPATSQTLPPAVAVLQTVDGVLQVTCSGVPIDAKIILTAGHCLKIQPSAAAPNPLSVMPRGQKNHSMAFKVLRWFVHPEFKSSPDPKNEDFDIALLEIEKLNNDETEASPFPKATGFAFQSPGLGNLWIIGFSPTRLRFTEPQQLLKTNRAWSPVDLLAYKPNEGKFLARSSSPSKIAACPGDSGAPVWDFNKPQRRLKGIVVQANCEKGEVKFIDVARYSPWISQTVSKLNEGSQVPLVASNNGPEHRHSMLRSILQDHE